MDKRKFFKVLVLRGTKDVLSYLNEHGRARYKELEQFASAYTLTMRLRELLEFKLIEHHFVKENVREEWYEITDSGRRVLTILRELEELWREDYGKDES